MSQPLKIILVMIEPPLPFGNAAARWFYVLLKGLVDRGHHVTAFASCSKPADMAKARDLFPAPIYDLRCYPIEERKGWKTKLETLHRPYSYIFSPQLQNDLSEVLQQPFDILHLEDLWSGWLGTDYRSKSLLNIHYQFSIDGTFQNPNNLKQRLQGWLTQVAETRLLRSFPHITTLSDRLKQSIAQVSPQSSIYTVPLGIDPSLYPFIDQPPINSVPTVGLIGSFNWTPTYTAAERLINRLWPQIKQQIPNAKLQIVGRAAKDALGQYSHLPDITLYPDVPDTLPYFQSSDVLLYAPAAGSGMKVKVMEAFALGTPVVTTTEGIEGLPAQDGVHAGVCDEDQGLIERTVQLLLQPQQRQQQRRQARQLLESYCGPKTTIDQLEAVYTSVLQH
jgi:polysaccharide biosynthesis protein PslH